MPGSSRTMKGCNLERGAGELLVVDDQPLRVERLHNRLARWGAHVLSFYTSTAALVDCTAHRAAIDLLGTDMNMAGMTGEVVQPPMVSAQAGAADYPLHRLQRGIDETRARLIGIREFILKPVVPRNLAQAIGTLFQDGKHPHSR